MLCAYERGAGYTLTACSGFAWGKDEAHSHNVHVAPQGRVGAIAQPKLAHQAWKAEVQHTGNTNCGACEKQRAGRGKHGPMKNRLVLALTRWPWAAGKLEFLALPS